jgi:hypothetical protein
MPIEFEGGSIIDTSDWLRIKRILAEKGRQEGENNGVHEPKIMEIRSSDGVNVKVGNLELKKKQKMPLAQPNYVEGKHKGWTIRAWRQDTEEIFGCNYFRGEDVRYFELSFGDVSDENAVFKVAKRYIEDAISDE